MVFHPLKKYNDLGDERKTEGRASNEKWLKRIGRTTRQNKGGIGRKKVKSSAADPNQQYESVEMTPITTPTIARLLTWPFLPLLKLIICFPHGADISLVYVE